MELRRLRLKAAFVYHASIIAAGAGLAFMGLTLEVVHALDAGVTILLLHILTFRLITLDRLFQQWRVRSYTCSVCEQSIDLCNHWSCKGKSCGYTTERHLFSLCPQCGKGFAWLNCPRCGTSHLI
jgi:hypothetical protein